MIKNVIVIYLNLLFYRIFNFRFFKINYKISVYHGYRNRSWIIKNPDNLKTVFLMLYYNFFAKKFFELLILLVPKKKNNLSKRRKCCLSKKLKTKNGQINGCFLAFKARCYPGLIWPCGKCDSCRSCCI